MELKKFNELRIGDKYLLDKSDFVKNNDERLIYIGEYLSPNTSENIKKNTNNELKKVLASFTIEAELLEDGLYISPLQIIKINELISQDTINENISNEIVMVYADYHKATIFNKFSQLSHILNRSDIHLSYYKEIESILDQDLSKDVEKHKKEHNIEDFLTADEGIFNPIINLHIEKIEAQIIKISNEILNPVEKDILLQYAMTKGLEGISTNAYYYLLNKYHKKELEVIAYNDATNLLNQSLLYFDTLLGGSGKSITTAQEDVTKLFYLIAETLKNIKIKPDTDEEITNIMAKMNDNIFNPFIGSIEQKIGQHDNQELVNEIDKNMNIIYDNVTNIIILKNYEYENVDINSVLGLYTQLEEHIDTKNYENIISTLEKLATYSPQKLSQLSSEHKIKLLYNIIEYDDDNNLQRNKDTLGVLSEDKIYIEDLMNEAIKSEKYKLASFLRDLLI